MILANAAACSKAPAQATILLKESQSSPINVAEEAEVKAKGNRRIWQNIYKNSGNLMVKNTLKNVKRLTMLGNDNGNE